MITILYLHANNCITIFLSLLRLLVTPSDVYHRVFLLLQTILERLIFKETEAQGSKITCPSSQGLGTADLGMLPRTMLCFVAPTPPRVLRRGTALSLPPTTYSERKANRVLCRCHFWSAFLPLSLSLLSGGLVPPWKPDSSGRSKREVGRWQTARRGLLGHGPCGFVYKTFSLVINV